MKFENINKKFTEIVTEYIGKGFYVNARTMTGSQGEIAKVDLTDGTRILRIVMGNFRDSESWLEGVEIVAGWVMQDKPTPNIRQDETVWNNHLDVVLTERFYQIGREDCRRSCYYGTEDEAKAAVERNHQRYRARQGGNRTELSSATYRLAHRMVRKIPKTRGIKVSDMEAVYTQTERNLDGTVRKHYYAKAAGRIFTLH